MPTAKILIKDGALCEDIWQICEADAADLPDAPCLISLDRLKAQADMHAQHAAPLGVILRAGSKAGEDVRALAPFLDRLALVAIEFPAYRNGRGYSSARILRDELNFTGEIRAIGEVLYDQWAFMTRCGINAFEVDAHVTPDMFAAALAQFSHSYQPAGDERRGIMWQRHL